MDKSTQFKWCELILRQTREWAEFERADRWLSAYALSKEKDLERYKMLCERFEKNIVEPLERKWQKILTDYKLNKGDTNNVESN